MIYPVIFYWFWSSAISKTSWIILAIGSMGSPPSCWRETNVIPVNPRNMTQSIAVRWFQQAVSCDQFMCWALSWWVSDWWIVVGWNQPCGYQLLWVSVAGCGYQLLNSCWLIVGICCCTWSPRNVNLNGNLVVIPGALSSCAIDHSCWHLLQLPITKRIKTIHIH